MLSRVADSLYWMSRYFERADNIARVIDATHSLMLSRAEVATDQRWFRALNALGLQVEAGNPDPQEAIRRLAADVTHRGSMISCLAAARENASQVREEISAEMWEHLNRLYHEAVGLSVTVEDDETVMRLVTGVREGSYAFHGVSETTMTHGEGWRFVQLGKYTERACAVSLKAITAQSTGRPRAQIGRIIGRLRSSLAFSTVNELRSGDLHSFLNGVLEQCRAIHAAVHDAYIDYPIEIAFES